MMTDKDLTDDVLDEIIAGAKTSMEQYLALSLKAERAAKQKADVNSPVIQDGWVLVPEEPTHEMLEAGDEQFGTYDVYRRMIAAAPQQEEK
ncbi:TPA: hypothetical protein ACJJXK_004302 [Enterobacter asburiae]